MKVSLAYEGHFESFFQFILQLYIIFTKADRNPSTIQLVSLFTSLLTMVISGERGYFSTEDANKRLEAKCNKNLDQLRTPQEMSLDKLKYRIYHFPLFLSGYLFYLGSLVMISIIFPLYTMIGTCLLALACFVYAIIKSVINEMKITGTQLTYIFFKGKIFKSIIWVFDYKHLNLDDI